MAVASIRSNGTVLVVVYTWDPVLLVWVPQGADLSSTMAPDPLSRPSLGVSVSLSEDEMTIATANIYGNGDGTTTIVVEVFSWNAGSGTWVQKGPPISASGDGGSTIPLMMSADGSTVAFASIGSSGTLQVSVYSWDPASGMWLPPADAFPQIAGTQSEVALSVSADAIVVTVVPTVADADGPSVLGPQMFALSDSGSDQTWEALPVDPMFAGKLVFFSGDGLLAAVSFPGDGNGTAGFGTAGFTQVYQYDNTTETWDPYGSDLGGTVDGVLLSASGTTLVLTFYAERNRTDSGHVRIFTWDDAANDWLWTGDDIRGAGPSTVISLSADGLVFAISADDSSGGRLLVYRVTDIRPDLTPPEQRLSAKVDSGTESSMWVWVAVGLGILFYIVAMMLLYLRAKKRARRKARVGAIPEEVETGGTELDDALRQLDEDRQTAGRAVRRSMSDLTVMLNRNTADLADMESATHHLEPPPEMMVALNAAVVQETKAQLEEAKLKREQETKRAVLAAANAEFAMQAELDALRAAVIREDGEEGGNSLASADAGHVASQVNLLELRLALAEQGKDVAFTEHERAAAATAEDMIFELRKERARLLGLARDIDESRATANEADRAMLDSERTSLSIELFVVEQRLKLALEMTSQEQSLAHSYTDMMAYADGLTRAASTSEAAVSLLLQAEEMANAASNDGSSAAVGAAAAIAAEEAAAAIKASVEQELQILRNRDALLAAKALHEQDSLAAKEEDAAATEVAVLEAAVVNIVDAATNSGSPGGANAEAALAALNKQLRVAQLRLRLAAQRKQRSARSQQALRLQSSLVQKLASANASKADAAARLKTLITDQSRAKKSLADALSRGEDTVEPRKALHAVETKLRIATEKDACSRGQAKAQFEQWVESSSQQDAELEAKSAEQQTNGALMALAQAAAMAQSGLMSADEVEEIASAAKAAVDDAVQQEVDMKTQQQLLAVMSDGHTAEKEAAAAQEAALVDVDRLTDALAAVTGQHAEASRAAIEKQLKIAELKLRLAANRVSRSKRAKSARRVQVSLVHRVAAANKARREAEQERATVADRLRAEDIGGAGLEAAAASGALFAANTRLACSVASTHRQLDDWVVNTSMADVENEVQDAAAVSARAVQVLMRAAEMQRDGDIDTKDSADFLRVSSDVRQEMSEAIMQETQFKIEHELLISMKRAADASNEAQVTEEDAGKEVTSLANQLAAMDDGTVSFEQKSRHELERQLKIAQLRLKLATARAGRSKRDKSARRVHTSLVQRMAAANKARQDAERERLAAETSTAIGADSMATEMLLLAADQRVFSSVESAHQQFEDWFESTSVMDTEAEVHDAAQVTAGAVEILIAATEMQRAGTSDEAVYTSVASEVKEAISQEMEFKSQHALLMSMKTAAEHARHDQHAESAAANEVATLTRELTIFDDGTLGHDSTSREETEKRLRVAYLRLKLAENRVERSKRAKSARRVNVSIVSRLAAATKAQQDAKREKVAAEAQLQSAVAQARAAAGTESSKTAAEVMILAADTRVACAVESTNRQLSDWVNNTKVEDIETEVQDAGAVTLAAVDALISAAEVQRGGGANTDEDADFNLVASAIRLELKEAIKQEMELQAQHVLLTTMKAATEAAAQAQSAQAEAAADVAVLKRQLTGFSDGTIDFDESSRAAIEKQLRIAKLRLKLASNRAGRQNRSRSTRKLKCQRLVIMSQAHQDAAQSRAAAEEQLRVEDQVGSSVASETLLLAADERVASSAEQAHDGIDEWTRGTTFDDLAAEGKIAAADVDTAIDALLQLSTLETDSRTSAVDGVETLAPLVQKAAVVVKEAVEEEIALASEAGLLKRLQANDREELVQAALSAAQNEVARLTACLVATPNDDVRAGSLQHEKRRALSHQIEIESEKVHRSVATLEQLGQMKQDAHTQRSVDERKLKAIANALEQAGSTRMTTVRDVMLAEQSLAFDRQRGASVQRVQSGMKEVAVVKERLAAVGAKIDALRRIRSELVTDIAPPRSPFAGRKTFRGHGNAGSKGAALTNLKTANLKTDQARLRSMLRPPDSPPHNSTQEQVGLPGPYPPSTRFSHGFLPLH